MDRVRQRNRDWISDGLVGLDLARQALSGARRRLGYACEFNRSRFGGSGHSFGDEGLGTGPRAVFQYYFNDGDGRDGFFRISGICRFVSKISYVTSYKKD